MLEHAFVKSNKEQDDSLEKELKKMFIEKSSSDDSLSMWAKVGETSIFFIYNLF